jgi:hypothetical protein
MSDSKGIFRAEGDLFEGDSAEERAPSLTSPGQRPLAARTADYVETQYLSAVPAPDGGVMMGGGDPPGPALLLTENNLVCTEDESTGRQECEFLVQWLTEAEGITKGVGTQPMQIRRYCTRLQTASELMEIGEIAVFACSARRPVDVKSRDLIRDFKRRQLEQAAEHAQERGERDL